MKNPADVFKSKKGMKFMAVRFLIVIFAFISVHIYVLRHVWQQIPIPVWGKWGVVLLAVCALILFFFVVTSRHIDSLPMPVSSAIYKMGTSWFFVMLYLLMLYLVLDLGRLCRLVPGEFLHDSWWGTATVAAIIVVTFAWGNIHYHHKVRRPLTLTTAKSLPKPLRIVMMSDLHLGYGIQRPEFQRWIDMIKDEKPDLVLIAGDIIDRNIRPLEEQRMWEEFQRLNVPVVACLGNHDYYAGQSGAQEFYKKAGIRLLRDEALQIDGVTVVGRDDRLNMRRKSVKTLMDGVDRQQYVILLDHQPYHLEEAEKAGVDFQLSGHTHYGQVWPVSWITDAIYEVAFGAYQKGATRYYVSSGMGIWGGKFRIGTCSEYVVADLVSEK